MSKLEELIAERDRLQEEVKAAQARLDAADNAVLEERFKDDDRYQVGDIILVPRKLFGQIKWWPAKITAVRLDYNEGTYAEDDRFDWSGQHWSHRNIWYTVTLQTKDGAFTGGSDAFEHKQVQAAPAQEASNG
jgi:hypothetical protein